MTKTNTSASKPAQATSASRAQAARTKGARLAGAITLLLGAPMVFLFTSGMADAVTRDQQTPLRALLGNERYETLMAFDDCAANGEVEGTRCGELEMGFPHYAGQAFEAPDFTVTSLSGETWTLSAHRGKTLVINFWSITCPPCLEEMPSIEILAEMLEGRDDVEVVAISADPDPQQAMRVVAERVGAIGSDGRIHPERLHVNYLFDRGGNNLLRESFGTELYPETWIIDERGVVRLRFDGARDWSSALTLDVIDRL